MNGTIKVMVWRVILKLCVLRKNQASPVDENREADSQLHKSKAQVQMGGCTIH